MHVCVWAGGGGAGWGKQGAQARRVAFFCRVLNVPDQALRHICFKATRTQPVRWASAESRSECREPKTAKAQNHQPSVPSVSQSPQARKGRAEPSSHTESRRALQHTTVGSHTFASCVHNPYEPPWPLFPPFLPPPAPAPPPAPPTASAARGATRPPGGAWTWRPAGLRVGRAAAPAGAAVGWGPAGEWGGAMG